MARTLHQAMAYLGLGSTEYETGKQERDRHPATIYEETVFEAEDSYQDYSYQEPTHPQAPQRDVLLGLAAPAPALEAQKPLRVEQAPAPSPQQEDPVESWQEQAAETDLTTSLSTTREESSEELRRITTIHPRSYNDAKIIGESFRENIPVIMNVTDMGETDAKRLIDFSAGLAFALNGHIERVTDKVFLLTPANLEVLGAEGAEVPVALDSDDVTPFNHI